jgi:hypothetical protein
MSNHIVDTDLFQAVFRMIEKENEDSYLVKKLGERAEIVQLDPEAFALDFGNGFLISIKGDLEVYHIHSTNPLVYCNNEDATTKLSGDRVYFYLKRILDLVMFGR